MKELVILQRALYRDNLPLDTRNKLNQRALQLAEYLRTAKDPTDEGAAQTLGVDRTGTHYRKIRQRLKNGLINGLMVATAQPRGEGRPAEQQRAEA
ncbi:hypothetical protein [Lewinella sp. IMCC34183]|uniref:hypothetical protein n=1 Tax=Lewinella sp. IMCC34183 TaxID=2248762 RepID=UPI001300A2BD|nr:hypothetical protein [Lewinella sp. IMCC34183]